MRHVTETSIVKRRDALSRLGAQEASRRAACAWASKPTSRLAGESLQKSDQIVCHVIDMRRVAAFKLPAFAKYFAGVLGHDQYGGHAERMWHHEITGQVFEHRRLARVDIVRLEKAVIRLRRRFRFELGRDDVEHVIEVAVELETRQDGIGMSARAVGQDQLAPGQSLDRGAQRRVRGEGRMVNLMHEIEKVVGFHAMLGHQSAHRGAVALVVIFLQAESLLLRDLEISRDVVPNPLVNLLPQVEVMWIKRVVEVEDPSLHMNEGARRPTS